MTRTPDADVTLSLLLIEDNPGDARLIERLLEEAGDTLYRLQRAATLAEGLVHLHAAPVDIALVDLGLPDSQGLATCTQVIAAAPGTAVLVLSDQHDGDIALTAFQAGAQDYLEKGWLDGPLLVRALRYAVERKRNTLNLEQLLEEKQVLVSALERANRELEERRAQQAELAVHDPLTGLYNRRVMDRFLREELARSTRYDQHAALIIMDLDHFKRVNDTWGHQAGDQVLTALGRLLVEALRPSDRAIRYGGEEFVVIAPMTPAAHGEELAERLRRRVETTPFTIVQPDGGSATLKLTISLGLAWAPDHAGEPEGLLAAADAALYEAKRRGRNRVV